MNTYPSSFVPSSMVSPQDSHSNPSHLPTTPPFYSPSSVSCTKIQRSLGRSMRTVRSNLYQTNHNTCSFPGAAPQKSASACVSENLTDSVVDLRLGELAGRTNKSVNSSSSDTDFFDLSQAFSDFSVCSSDISGELQRLATIPAPENSSDPNPEPVSEPCAGFLDRDSFSTEIIESISPEDLQPTVKICIDGLRSSSTAVKRSAAAKLRLLAKNRSDNRALIGESGAVPALIPLLRCTDPMTQEHAVTALLNLSLLEENKARITSYGAIKALIYVLKTGTETSKQNAACALLNLSLIDENKISIGACGAIPPLITLLMNGSNRGKKDAMTTLYKLCTVKVNKERAVKALYYCYLVGKGGELTHDETTIISGALDLTQKTTKDAMTPLSEIFSLDLNSKLDKDTMSLIMSKGHSCIPVYSGSPSNIIGLILVKNLIKCRAEDETPIRILTIGRIPRVEDSLPLYDILNQFQKGHSHMAAVVKSKHNVKGHCRKCNRQK